MSLEYTRSDASPEHMTTDPIEELRKLQELLFPTKKQEGELLVIPPAVFIKMKSIQGYGPQFKKIREGITNMSEGQAKKYAQANFQQVYGKYRAERWKEHKKTNGSTYNTEYDEYFDGTTNKPGGVREQMNRSLPIEILPDKHTKEDLQELEDEVIS